MSIALNQRQKAVLQFVSLFERPVRLSDIYQLEDYELFEYQRQVRAALTFLENNGFISSQLMCNRVKVKYYSISSAGSELIEKSPTIKLKKKTDVCAILNSAFKVTCCTTRSYNTPPSTKAAI